MGAGLTGLVVGWRLLQAGLPVTVFEATDRAGGPIRTRRDGPWLAEDGPNTVRLTPEIDALIDELGLRPQLVTANTEAARRFIVKNGRLSALPTRPQALLWNTTFGWRDKWRLVREPARPFLPPGEDISIADLLRPRIGQRWLDYAVNPFLGGVFTGRPEELSAQYALPKLWAGLHTHGAVLKWAKAEAAARRARQEGPPTLFSFQDGQAVLPTALAERLGNRLRLNHRLTHLHRHEHGWTLRFQDGTTSLADRVVLALPAPALLSLVLPDPLPAGLAPLRQLVHPPVSLLHVGFDRLHVAHALNGFGFLVPEVEKRQILGALFVSSIFQGRAPEGHVLLTVFFGGARQPDLADLPADRQLLLAQSELRALIGLQGAPKWVARTRWGTGIPQYKVGHGAVVAAVQATEALAPTLHLAGHYTGGIGVPDRIAAAEQVAAAVLNP